MSAGPPLRLDLLDHVELAELVHCEAMALHFKIGEYYHHLFLSVCGGKVRLGDDCYTYNDEGERVSPFLRACKISFYSRLDGKSPAPPGRSFRHLRRGYKLPEDHPEPGGPRRVSQYATRALRPVGRRFS